MTKTAEPLKVDERKLDVSNHAELLKIVVNQKKAELDDLSHKVLLAKNNLRAIEQGCKRTQSEFNQKMAQEKQDIERLKVKARNDYAHQEEKNQQAVSRLNERETRLLEKENAQVKLDAERKAIYKQRVELEKTNASAQEELRKALALKDDATGKIDQAALKEQQAEKKMAEADQRNSSADYLFGKAAEKEKKVKADLENIQKIRTEITPQITKLEALEKKNEKILAEAKESEDKANAKVKENEQALANMKKQYEVLKSKEIEIASREEEVSRQEIIIESVKKKGK